MPDASSSSKTSKPAGLPPGMVLGPDGKPCKICTAFRYWTPPTTDGNTKTSSKTSAMMASMAFGAAAATKNTNTTAIKRDDGPPAHCPPDVEVLGRSTWTFLHTTAAYYPTKPTPSQRANMLSLLHSLPVLYPCGHCADHLRDNLQDNPPDVSGREGLSRWLCQRHNDVNERLGKERFDCGIKSLDERWKDGPEDGSCD